MDPTSEPEVEITDSVTAPETQPISKPKRPRRIKQRRPKHFPTTIKTRLNALGYELQNYETNEQNLNFLIERLSTALENYHVEAKEWQEKYLRLKNTIDTTKPEENKKEQREDKSDTTPIRSPTSRTTSDTALASSSNSDPLALVLPTTHESSGINAIRRAQQHLISASIPKETASAFHLEIFRKLDTTANPKLSFLQMSLPRLISEPTGFSGTMTFEMVMDSVESMANLFGLTTTESRTRWKNIVRLKPDFSCEKAVHIWNNLFAPINVDPSRLIFDAGPSSRREEDEDPDMDHLDRVLAVASDIEVIEMLHYCSLLVGGLHQIVFEHENMMVVREHIGKSCERLLREAVISRNLSANPLYAQSLMDGVLGTISHFVTRDKNSATVSVLEIAWGINVQHEGLVHSVTKGLVAFMATMLAPTPDRRTLWMNRNMEIFNSSSGRFFQLTITSVFTAAYYALFTNDQDALLHYVAQLDELLAPTPLDATSDSPQTPGGSEDWDFSAFHPLPHDINPSLFSRDQLKSGPGFLNFTAPPPSKGGDLIAEHNHYYFHPTVDTPTSESVTEPTIPYLDQLMDPTTYINEYGAPYSPAENLKTLLRVSVHLIRAEAALIYADYETCEYWVDTAERILKSLPMLYTSQKIYLMKNVFKTTCPFPSGIRTVSDEFERRMVEHDIEQLRLIREKKANMTHS